MVLENVPICVLETATAQPSKDGKVPSHKYVAAVAGKDKSPIATSKRLILTEYKFKTDESLTPGDYIATISISAYSVNGNTGESLVIMSATPVVGGKK